MKNGYFKREAKLMMWLFLMIPVIGVTAAVIIPLLKKHHTQPQLQERVHFWRDSLAKEVPIGTNKERIMEWGAAHHFKFDYLEKQHWLYANVEAVPEKGIPFPCSQWNIILEISIDKTGHSTNNEVSTVGTCL
jgi:hypothetical protein